MRKLIRLAAIALTTAMLVSACGSKPAVQEPAKTEEQKPVTITYAFWDQKQEGVMKEIVARFNEKHPKITVELQVTPFAGYWEKVQTLAAGGDGYDVFWMNGPNFPFYASRGVLLDVTTAMKDAGLADKYPQALVDMYSYGGKNYGFPKDFDTIGLYYNKKAFAEAGIPLPPNDWSWKWDDFVAAARKLTKDANGKRAGEAGFDGNNIAQYGLAFTAGQPGHFNMIFSNGGWLISSDKKKSGYDDPATVDAMEKLMSLMHKEKVAASGATLSKGAPEAEKLFLAGKAAMIFHGSWRLKPYLDQKDVEVGFTYLPVMKRQATVIHGLSNAVYAKTKHPKEAVAFATFLGGKEAADILAKTGTVIPAYKGTQDTWVNSFTGVDASIFIKMADKSFPLPASPANVELAPVEQETMERLWSNKGDVKELLSALAKKQNEVLGTR